MGSEMCIRDSFTGITTTTDSNGEYQFTDLMPGDYVVVVPRSNFLTGGVLDGLTGTSGNNLVDGTAPDPDDDLDNDDNGTRGFSLGIINVADDTLISGFDTLSKPVTLSYGDEPNGGFDNPTVDFGFKNPD